MITVSTIARFCAIALPLFATAACATASATDNATDLGPRIIAIGDLHGDYDAYRALIEEADLVNARGRWIGGDTIFVQTGDIPDRGPDSRKIIDHLRKLEKSARRRGGRVVTLVGNHEAMNVNGDLRYVHPGEYAAFETRDSAAQRSRIYEANQERIESAYRETDPDLTADAIRAAWEEQTPLGMIEHRRAFAPDGDIGGWIAGNDAVAIVGDSLFVHGGVSQFYADRTVDDINAAVKSALAAAETSPQSIINDPDGPLWYRGNIRREAEVAEPPVAIIEENAPVRLAIEDELNLVLTNFGVKRLIVGHTPNLEGIAAHFNGKLIQVDTGIADYYGGTRSFLRIEGGAIFAHDNGAVRKIGGEDHAE